MFILIAYTIFVAFVVSALTKKFPIMQEFANYTLGFEDDLPSKDLYSEDEDTDNEEDIDSQHEQEEKSLSPENKTKDGYEKDGFVVDDDDDDSDPDYNPDDCEEVAQLHDHTTDEDETY